MKIRTTWSAVLPKLLFLGYNSQSFHAYRRTNCSLMIFLLTQNKKKNLTLNCEARPTLTRFRYSLAIDSSLAWQWGIFSTYHVLLYISFSSRALDLPQLFKRLFSFSSRLFFQFQQNCSPGFSYRPLTTLHPGICLWHH